MLDESDTPGPEETLESDGDPRAPTEVPEGAPPPGPITQPVKGDRSDELTKEGDAGDKLGDFA